MMMKKSKLGVFWRSYIILCAVLVVLVTALTVFFYDYIKAFETGRPEYAVNDYVASVTEADIIAHVTQALDGNLSGYEADDAVADEVSAALAKYDLSFVRAFTEETEGSIPSYDVYCGEKLLILTLSVTDGGKYGFDNYTVTGVDVADEWIDSRKTAVSVVVPDKAELTLNGKAVGEDKVVSEFSPETVSEFETDTFRLRMYEIADVFGKIDVTSLMDGEKLPLDNPTNGVYTSVYDAVDSVYTIIAPEGAEVAVNGITLTDKYVTGLAIPADAYTFESKTEIRCRVYSIKGLRLVPTVTAVLDGEVLNSAESEIYDSAFEYPDSYKSSYTVTLPDGATLYCNGVEVGDEYAVGKSDMYPIPDAAKKYEDPSDRGVTYVVTGLYSEPTFTAAYADDTSCVGGKEDDEWVFYPQPSKSETETLEDVAYLFTQLYVKYSYEGTDYTEANYNAVLEHVKTGSDAYKTMKASYSSMIYNSNFRVDKLEMEAFDAVRYADGCYGIKVHFDSHGKYYKYEKVSVGTYTMIWIVDGGEWLLVDFVFS